VECDKNGFFPSLSHLSIKCILNTEEKQQATFSPTEHFVTAATHEIFRMLYMPVINNIRQKA
jgi:hypothetical protein